MIATSIVAFGIWSLALWLVPYSRSLLLNAAEVEISGAARAAAELWGDSIRSNEFERIMALARIAPDSLNDSVEIHAISTYFRFLRVARRIAGHFSEVATRKLDLELLLCTHFAAITLDKRLTVAITR